MARGAISAAVLVFFAQPSWAQSGDLKGMELIGYHATAVSLATKSCGGEASRALREMTNLRDADFRFGMARAIGDWSGKLSGDKVAACAELLAHYGPNGSAAPGAWVPPR